MNIKKRIVLAYHLLTADSFYLAFRRGHDYYNGWDVQAAFELDNLSNLEL